MRLFDGITFKEIASSIPSYGRNIHDGYALLNYLQPDWMERVALSILDMGASENCILGQVFGDYVYIRSTHPLFRLLSREQMAYLGFITYNDISYEDLCSEHVNALQERRTALKEQHS